MFESRNKPIGFAQRTSKNLKFVNDAFELGGDVHVVDSCGEFASWNRHYP